MKNQSPGTSILAEIEIQAPPEAVFDALVSPDALAAWWPSDRSDDVTLDWKIDLRPGGEWSCEAAGVLGRQLLVRGHYKEVDRPRVLAFTWMPNLGPLARHRGRFTLSSLADRTRLDLLHEGFGIAGAQKGHAGGWVRILESLAVYCGRRGTSS